MAELNEYIRKLVHEYKDNPGIVSDELYNTMQRIEERKLHLDGKTRFQTLMANVNVEKFSVVFLGILIGLMGLFNIESYPLFIGGLVFFIAGMLIGLYEGGGPTLIFVFSHGLTGICIMVVALVNKIFSTGVMTDNPPASIIIYVGISIAFLVVGFLLVVMNSLIEGKLVNKYYIPIVFLLFSIGFFMLGLLNKIFPLLYSLR